MTKRAFLALIVTGFVIIGILPVLSMLFQSVMVQGSFSLASYAGLLSSARQWVLMGHSLALAALVTGFGVLTGVPLGILLGKTDLPLRHWFAGLFIIPLLIPPYIIAVSWSDLLGGEGLLTHLLGGSAIAANWLFALPGCAFVLFSIFLPIPMLLTMVFLRTITPRLEEAGRLVSGWGGVIIGISLPLILPGVLLSAMLVFLLAFSEFSVPTFLRYDVFPVESFIQFSAFYNFKAATAAALPMAGITLLLLLLEAVFLRERTYKLSLPAGSERFPLIGLGTWRYPLAGVVAILGALIVVVPILTLFIQAGGIDAYAEALRRAGASLQRSLVYSVIGATLLSITGFFIGYLIHTRALCGWRLVDSLTILVFALPGTVVGIGLVSLWNTPWTNFIYATPMIILLGYLAKYTALTSRITVTTLAQIPPSMEEAAQVAGAGWFRRMGLIVAPLARRGLITGWLVGYVFSLRDTAITMLVYPAGYETLPVRIFTLMANGSAPLIAALCVIMIAATLLPAGILGVLSVGMTKEVRA